MKTITLQLALILVTFFGLLTGNSNAQSYKTDSTQNKAVFKWPEGKKMGLCLTFDDARLTQVDKGIPLFDKYGVKATFYVSPDNMKQRLDGWKAAVKHGHDIGNHSLLHPCTLNYGWPPEAQLESYSLQRMNAELDSATSLITKMLGIQTVSFAYPCGQTFVGKGVNLKSYIPVVATQFETGRLWLSEGPNDPLNCDMAQITGMELDGKTFDQVKSLIESAAKKGQWLVLAGHEINDDGFQTSRLATIEAICKYASDPANGIWIDNVHNIAAYVKEKRGESQISETPLYKNPLFPIEQRINDLLSRMTLEEKIGQMNIPTCYSTELELGIEQ
ncbi:MAG: polysaccharide deacetylase family protein [Bacteroidales bacterium]|nr:polysaccharide deacetylase family protein [Bacteroidales bacterium]